MVTYSIPNKVHQGASDRFNTFISEHHRILSNYIVQRFLNEEYCYRIFVEAICYPTRERWETLNKSFQDFYTEVRLTDYISKTLWRYARDYRAKSNRRSSRFLLILDQPLQGEDGKSVTTFKDQLESNENNSTRKSRTLLEEVENQWLYNHLKLLKCRQLKILDLYYLHSFTQKEISNYLNISQQSVSKTLNTTIKWIRARLSGETSLLQKQ